MLRFSGHIHSWTIRQFCRISGVIRLCFCRLSPCSVVALVCLSTISTSVAQQTSSPGTQTIRADYRLDENAAPGTVVATLVSDYPELRNFRLSGDHASQAFTVEKSDGRIAVRHGAVLNYESSTLYRLSIQADVSAITDDPFLRQFADNLLEEGITSDHVNELLTATQTIAVRIRLRNVPEAPRLSGCSFEIPENSPRDSVIGTPVAEDPDSQSALKYRILSGNDQNLFAIHPDSGSLTVMSGQELDFESHAAHHLKVQVCDSDGLTADADVIVQLTDVDEKPLVPGGNDTHTELVSNEPTQLEDLQEASRSGHAAKATDSDIRPADSPGAVITAEEESSATETVNGDPRPDRMAESADPPLPAPNVSTIADVARAPRELVHEWPADGPLRDNIVPSIVSTATKNSTSESTLVRDLLVLVCVLSVAGFVVFRTYQKKKAARLEAFLEQQAEDEGRNSAAGAMIPEITEPTKSEAKQPQVDSKASKPKNAVETSDTGYATASAMDPESLISDEFFNETDSSTAFTPAKMVPPEVVRQLQLMIEERDVIIADLTSELASASYRRGSTTSPERADRHFRDDDEYETDQTSAEISANPRDERPFGHPHEVKSYAASGPHENLTLACENLERMLDRLSHVSSDHPEARRHEAITTGVATSQEEESDNLKKKYRPEATSTEVVTAARPAENLKDASVESEPAWSTSEETTAPDKSIPELADDSEPESVAGNQSSEESHLDSVAQYLSVLLDRSSRSGGGDDIFVDRRKASTKWDGKERRAQPKPMQPVKSYIETYLNEHGGLPEQEPAERPPLSPLISTAPSKLETRTPVVRTPVDVRTIREHMTSFREIASRSAENALLSYNRRQAKNKRMWRSTLLGVMFITTIMVVIATNPTSVILIGARNWLIWAAALLTAVELCLRVLAVRRHRWLHRLHALEPLRKSEHGEAAAMAVAEESLLPEDIAQAAVESEYLKSQPCHSLALPLS